MKYCLLFALSFIGPSAFSQKNFAERLSDAALELTTSNVTYDGSYKVLKYPGGDVASDRGVCTDVIIRAYRTLGIDLQVLVHEDMKRAFSVYPQSWRMKKPDRNIDHRRVPNLMAFFTRNGRKLSDSTQAKDYAPGDIVCWNLGGAITHIGIVVNRMSSDGKRPLIVHNIGGGQVVEDCVFNFTIIGHYRFNPQE